MASKKRKLIKVEIPEDKVSSYPDLGAGWKVEEKWRWNNNKNKLECHRSYISPSCKKFKNLKLAQQHVTLVNELGPDWTVKVKGPRKIKHYYSPSEEEFSSLKQAKAHVAKSLAKAATSITQDEREVEEKKNDTGASSSTLMDLDATPLPPFESSSMDIDRVVDGDNGAKSKKGKHKQPPKRKRNDSDSIRSGGSGLSVGNVVLVVKKKRKKKKKVMHQRKPVDDVDDEERLRQENKLRCEEQQRAETEKQADKRRKEEDKLKRKEDAEKKKIKEDRKRKRVEEEDEKRRIVAVSWSLICSYSVSMLLVHFSLAFSSVTLLQT